LNLGYPVARHRLGNGLLVVASEDHATPSVTVHLHYGVGARHEEPGRTGLAHLFEHLMFEGSAHVQPGEHAGLMNAWGATWNGLTSADSTVYFEHVPAGVLELALWLEADRMATLPAGLTPALLDTQRAVIGQEWHQTVDGVPFGDTGDRLLALVYPSGHPYHRPLFGSPGDLDQATTDDVAQFFSTWYVPANAVLAVTGDAAPDQVFEAAERYFGPVPAGPAAPQPPARLLGPAQAPCRDDACGPVPFAMTALGFRFPPNSITDPAIFAADMALRILTDRARQVLVRDMQAAQQVASATDPRSGGDSFAFITVPAMPGVPAYLIEKTLTAELETLAATGPEDDEVARAAATAERELLAALSGIAGRACQLAFFTAEFGEPDAVNSYPARIRAITPAQVRGAAATWLRPDCAATVTTSPATASSPPSQE
jgi:zinc protease